jgi:hypothetical protein
VITTTLYGLKKPEDSDVADLRIFVGDNMDILEAKLNAIETTGGGTEGAIISDSTGGTGSVTKIWTGTEAQYLAVIKDPTTLYYIVE